jgi:hypothetical protein
MVVLRVIIFVFINICILPLMADTLPKYRHSFGLSFSKPFELVLPYENIKNELFFSLSKRNNLRFQFSGGFEKLNLTVEENNEVNGMYIRLGFNKSIHVNGSRYWNNRFYCGFNLFANYYKHKVEIKPLGQFKGDFYLQKESISKLASIEAELGINLYKSSNKKFSFICVQRTGFVVVQPKMKYYAPELPGIKQYNMNRLYWSAFNIVLMYSFK